MKLACFCRLRIFVRPSGGISAVVFQSTCSLPAVYLLLSPGVPTDGVRPRVSASSEACQLSWLPLRQSAGYRTTVLVQTLDRIKLLGRSVATTPSLILLGIEIVTQP